LAPGIVIGFTLAVFNGKHIQMSDLTLYIGNKNYSSWSLRPWIAMRVFDIPFREVLIPFDFDSGNPDIKAISPSGRVPLLIDGRFNIWESVAILEYLAELFPEKAIWPTGRAARALARSISSEMATGFSALRNHCPFNMHRAPKALVDPSVLSPDVTRIDAIWKSCLEMSGGPFLFGEFSAADAMYAPIVSRFSSFDLMPSETAAAYMSAIKSLPAWSEWEGEALKESWIVTQSEI
jgi:glutathione S-transferase